MADESIYKILFIYIGNLSYNDASVQTQDVDAYAHKSYLRMMFGIDDMKSCYIALTTAQYICLFFLFAVVFI